MIDEKLNMSCERFVLFKVPIIHQTIAYLYVRMIMRSITVNATVMV